MTDEMYKSLHALENAINKLGVHNHLCLIYESREEQFAAIMPFIRMGLERGEKCFYVADDNTAAVVIDEMKTAGLEVGEALSSGRLVIASKKETYLREGFFDPDHMIAFMQRSLEDAKAAGFSALRVTGEMTWVLGGDEGAQRLMEYEAKLNYFFPANEALAICQYARKRFSPEVIKDVIATHPLVICGGMACENFYYIPPDSFLEGNQVDKEVDRLLGNIKERAKVEDELRRRREALEKTVEELKARTTELERKNQELEHLNRAFVGRELRMIELKNRIRELECKK